MSLPAAGAEAEAELNTNKTNRANYANKLWVIRLIRIIRIIRDESSRGRYNGTSFEEKHAGFDTQAGILERRKG
jgi:hypothetical protein